MSTWAGHYVRLRAGADRAKDLARLQAVDPSAEVSDDGTSAFAMCVLTSSTFQPEDLTGLSRDFGEAIAIAVQPVADLIIYDHFVKGEHVRGLTYAGEAGWIRVVGEPEAWEARALFSAVRLAELSEELEQDLDGELLAREKAELERLWLEGKLVEGSTRPPADSQGLPKVLERYFSLPPRPTARSIRTKL